MSKPGHINQQQLAQWADSMPARSEFPRLLRKLILETTPGVVQLGFPAGEGVSSGGWDGTVKASEASPYVPQGLSLWEASVEKSAQTKADRDYAKRSSTPDGTPTTDATYVAAIARRWLKRDDWAKGKRQDRKWQDVKAVGLDDLETWLEMAPATWAWISEVCGLHPFGLRSADRWWEIWTQETNPTFPIDAVLAGREQAVDQLLGYLSGEPNLVTLTGGSLEELTAFVIAIAKRTENEGSSILARTVLVDDAAALRSLLLHNRPLVLILAAPELAREVPRGVIHHVVVPLQRTDSADIELPAIHAGKAAKAFESLTLNRRDNAGALGELARRSLTALRRHLASKRELHAPAWAATPLPITTRAALLAGRWHDRMQGDCAIIEQLAGSSYAQAREEILKLASREDPFVAIVDDGWDVVSPYDAWKLLSPHLQEADLQDFQAVVEKVFGEIDPAIEFSDDDRWRASIDGKQRSYSSDLRNGLARTLALMGAEGSETRIGHSTLENWARGSVAKLLRQANDDATGKHWTSIADVLPLLAESAPDAFLDAVKDGLGGNQPVLKLLFSDTDSSIFSSRSAHTELLWAVEGIAWSQAHFSAAVDVLARLAEIDPGGRTMNRPSNTLASIFCPWFPSNPVSADRQLTILGTLVRRYPDVAWPLLLTILPESIGGIHHPTHEPVFRDWMPVEQAVPTIDYHRLVSAALGWLMELAGGSAPRWAELVKRYDDLNPEDRNSFLGTLTEHLDAENIDLSGDDILWKTLVEMTGRHREFADAQWALDDDALKPLDDLATRLAPTSSYERALPLFEDWDPSLVNMRRRDDSAAYERELGRRRAEAIARVEADSGLDRVLDVSRKSVVPHSVGMALADAVQDKYDTVMIGKLDSEDRVDVQVSWAYLARRFNEAGWGWIISLCETIADLSVLQHARLLGLTRDFPRAWEVAEGAGDEVLQSFWKDFGYTGLGGDFGFVEHAAQSLVDVGRCAAALDFISIYSRGTDGNASLCVAEIAAAALENLRSVGSGDAELQSLSEYDFQQTFALLEDHRDEIGATRIAALQWAFFRVLGHEPSAPSLHSALATDPSFFVELICILYRAHSGVDEPEAADPAIATNAFYLLRSLRQVPGTQDDGSFDVDMLNAWIDDVLPKLKEKDRHETGCQTIGGLLASAPADPDGTWPHKGVRELIERVRESDIETGFELQIHNQRGVTSRQLEEGGEQERSLAAKYRSDAETFQDEWPRLAAIFRNLAASYESQAQRNDDSAERFRRGIES
jgi:hypothetical protein